MQPGIVGGGAALAPSSIHPSHHHSCRLTGKRERGEGGLADRQREGENDYRFVEQGQTESAMDAAQITEEWV